MEKLKKRILDLVDEVGLEKAARVSGLGIVNLLKITDTEIDNNLAIDILGNLLKNNLIPKNYKNCKLFVDSMMGTLYWVCEWENREETISYATPFWENNNSIPIETVNYIIDQNGKKKTPDFYEFVEDNLIYNNVEIKFSGFKNIDLYINWIKKIYYPTVYKVISRHLNNLRMLY